MTQDVPFFIKWFHSIRDKAEGAPAGDAPATSATADEAAAEDTDHPHTVLPEDAGDSLANGVFKAST